MSFEYYESIQIIDNLFKKYKDDEYMNAKMYQYISNKLPKIFESYKNTHITNQTYDEKMQINQDSFVQSFLNNNKYLYISTTEKFFYYDNLHYKIYSEDDILHHILTSISKNRQLMSWKKSTKVHIMCKIKNNNLLKSIPNSETIQFVLELLYPNFFQTKIEAKYFLTILGDNIMKKNTNLDHFIDVKSKPFLTELNNFTKLFLGVSILTTFKHKYYEHDYTNCRFLNILPNISSKNLWNMIISEYFIDIACVATHYSIRYNSSDEFIISTNDNKLINYTFYIKNRKPDDLVQIFIDEYIEYNNQNNKLYNHISWKNMLYLWKHFLDSKNLPTVIFHNNMKQILIEKLNENYDMKMDGFNNIYSKFLPNIQCFLKFWDENMVVDNSESLLEIEEIFILFKKWNNNSTSINESQLFDLITYFYKNIETEDNKFIHKIRCSLWNKKEDINKALDYFMNINDENINEKISIYQAYDFYCKSQRVLDKFIVSKRYFENYISENMNEYSQLFYTNDI